MTFSRAASIACLIVGIAAPGLLAAPSGAGEKGPVKVFILAGQSNMEGKASAATLEPLLTDPKTREKFKHLKADGKWAVRDDVWVTFLCKKTKGPASKFPLHGPLTVGFGSDKNVRDAKGKRTRVAGFGPELGFGHAVGDHFKEQVLLIKTAWGGRSVRRTFRPPSAMPGDQEVKQAFEKAKTKNPDVKLADIKDSYGRDYRAMIAEVRKVLGNMKKYFPSYDEKQGYELAGLVWFQGWNDGCGRGNPDYTEQLAHLIRDLRKELKAPALPVVIGEMGIDGDKPMGWIEKFRKQQAAVAAIPEFKGNVTLAKTARFWPPWYKPLDDKWREFRAKSKAWTQKMKAEGKPPTRDQIREFGDKHWRRPNKDTIARMSDKRYHYMGCGRTYYLMGEAFGKAMVRMQSPARKGTTVSAGGPCLTGDPPPGTAKPPSSTGAGKVKKPWRMWANSFRWAKAPELIVEKWLTEKPDTKGKYVLIEFWATWCPPCRRSIPLLNSFHKKYGKELVVIGVSEESEADVRKLKKPKVEYYSAIDTKMRTKKALGVFGIPHVIILEPGGHVIWEGFPLLEDYELTDDIIEKILAVGRKLKAQKAAKKGT